MGDARLDGEIEVEHDGGDGQAVAVKAPWRPTDEWGVERVLDRIAQAKARAERIKANAAVLVEEAEKEAASLEARFGADLEDFARERLAATRGKSKTVKLLNGTLSFRTVPGGIEVLPEDEDAMLRWAEAYLPSAVTLKPVLDKAAVKARLGVACDPDGGEAYIVDDVTGEVIEWARVKPAQERFYIR